MPSHHPHDDGRDSYPGAVVITGMSGRLGRRLLRQLHRTHPVIGLGSRVPSRLPADVRHEPIEPLRSAARPIFRQEKIAAVVHLGVTRNPRMPRERTLSQGLLSFQKILEHAERFQIPKVVLLSSGNAYGPRPENAQFLTEEAPLLASGRFTEMQSLVELDMYAQSFLWRSPKTEVVILRPANILGTVRNAPSNYLRLQVVPQLMGFDPMVQAVHQDDVVQAIRLALRPGVRGVYNIAGPPPVPLSKAVKMLGRRSVQVPLTLAKSGLAGLFHMKISQFPAPELDFIRYVCMVDDSMARKDLGYAPRFDLERTLNAVDQERWS